MKRKLIFTVSAIVLLTTALFTTHHSLYKRKTLELTFDGAYYWTEKTSQYGQWLYEKVPAGHEYFLYLPEKYRNNNQDVNGKLPLIVVFHGSDEKSSSLSKYGRQFISQEFQNSIYPEGTAVLVILSRINYFTDPHSTSLLIQNICIKNKCIDKTNIIGWGFSQGAKFVVELACFEPALFRAVISGSGFYNIKARELVKVLPVQFYSAVSENDKGIFEQGSVVGRLCGKWCINSRYVQYKSRWHFWVELTDKTGRTNKDGTEETVMDWLVHLVNEK